jgi:hypothetical protein
MKKKPDYIPPKEIVVNGEIIKMHSSREERLRMAPVSAPRKNSSIFTTENRPRLILMIVLVVITIIGAFISSYFMKNKECMLEGIKVSMVRKSYDMGHMQTFKIQLRNTTGETLQLKENYILNFKMVNTDTGEIFFPEETENVEIILSKLTYSPAESFQKSIHIADIPDGNYVATWIIPTQPDFTFSFKVGRTRK